MNRKAATFAARTEPGGHSPSEQKAVNSCTVQVRAGDDCKPAELRSHKFLGQAFASSNAQAPSPLTLPETPGEFSVWLRSFIGVPSVCA